MMRQMMRWDIINKLIKDNDYKSYLEIGYYKGWNFDRIECAHKTATDPNPCKTLEQEEAEPGSIISDEHGTIYKKTSDDDFDDMPEEDKWGLIFIDGLHEADQVYRDIQNSVKHLAFGGTVVLH